MDETNDQKLRIDTAAAPAPVTSESVDLDNALPASSWKMPEPVFQHTSGYLPKGFEKRVEGSWAGETQTLETPVSNNVEMVDSFPAETPPASTERSRAMTIFLFLVGILAMIGLAIVLVAVLLYLYYSPEQISVFN